MGAAGSYRTIASPEAKCAMTSPSPGRLPGGGLPAASHASAVEYASRAVRFNAVALGVIENSVYDPVSYEGLAQLHPLGRVGQISDVVEGILYLEQASFVTGVVLHIDDGQSAGG